MPSLNDAVSMRIIDSNRKQQQKQQKQQQHTCSAADAAVTAPGDLLFSDDRLGKA
jgi:hypothetical protein